MTSPDELLQICRRTVDPEADAVASPSDHHPARTVRARTKHGEVIIKTCRSPERRAREVHAYQHWAPALGACAPRLLAHSEDPPAVVITAVPGKTLATLDLPPHAERDTYRRAGRLLRAWHDAEPPRADTDIATWLANRGEQWLNLAANMLDARQRERIHSHLRALANLGPLPARPCHLDFTPHNLVRTPDGDVALIDYEHARHDLAARDLVRLHNRVWSHRTDLRDAFLGTYGPLSNLDHEIIEHCTHLDALTSIARTAGLKLLHDANPPRE